MWSGPEEKEEETTGRHCNQHVFDSGRKLPVSAAILLIEGDLVYEQNAPSVSGGGSRKWKWWLGCIPSFLFCLLPLPPFLNCHWHSYILVTSCNASFSNTGDDFLTVYRLPCKFSWKELCEKLLSWHKVLSLSHIQLARPMSVVPNIPGIPGPPSISSGSISPSGLPVHSETKMVSFTGYHQPRKPVSFWVQSWGKAP